MATVEVGPGGAHDVMEVPEGSSYFHANTFQRLQVAQLHEESSIHRLKRAAEIPVSCPPRFPLPSWKGCGHIHSLGQLQPQGNAHTNGQGHRHVHSATVRT